MPWPSFKKSLEVVKAKAKPKAKTGMSPEARKADDTRRAEKTESMKKLSPEEKRRIAEEIRLNELSNLSPDEVIVKAEKRTFRSLGERKELIDLAGLKLLREIRELMKRR